MDEKTLHRVMTAISNEGPCILHNGRMYSKHTPRGMIKMHRATLMTLISAGYITIKNTHVIMTSKGRRVLDTRDNEQVRSATYAQRMRDRGRVRKSLWVHPEDLRRFEEFTTTLRGPNDD